MILQSNKNVLEKCRQSITEPIVTFLHKKWKFCVKISKMFLWNWLWPCPSHFNHLQKIVFYQFLCFIFIFHFFAGRLSFYLYSIHKSLKKDYFILIFRRETHNACKNEWWLQKMLLKWFRLDVFIILWQNFLINGSFKVVEELTWFLGRYIYFYWYKKSFYWTILKVLKWV